MLKVLEYSQKQTSRKARVATVCSVGFDMRLWPSIYPTFRSETSAVVTVRT